MKKLSLLLLAVVALGSLAFYASSKAPTLPNAGSADFNRIESGLTNTKAAVATTSASVLSKNSGRIYAALVNDGENTVYLGLGEAAVAGEGIRLNASGGSYEITPQNNITDAIYAITSSGTSTLTIVEK